MKIRYKFAAEDVMKLSDNWGEGGDGTGQRMIERERKIDRYDGKWGGWYDWRMMKFRGKRHIIGDWLSENGAHFVSVI